MLETRLFNRIYESYAYKMFYVQAETNVLTEEKANIEILRQLCQICYRND